jgi:hypothetical protein
VKIEAAKHGAAKFETVNDGTAYYYQAKYRAAKQHSIEQQSMEKQSMDQRSQKQQAWAAKYKAASMGKVCTSIKHSVALEKNCGET